jgi:hypothetical protein
MGENSNEEIKWCPQLYPGALTLTNRVASQLPRVRRVYHFQPKREASVDASRVPEMAQQQQETLATDTPKVQQAGAARVSFSPK